MLVVEVLLVPRQTGTSDTCAMEGEEQVLEVCLERGLDCLGWVRDLRLASRIGADQFLLDTYPSDAVMFHVFDGSTYPRLVSADVTRSDRHRLCPIAKQRVRLCPHLLNR